MNKLVLAFALGAFAVANPISSASAAATPCETSLKNLRAAEASAKVSDADKNKVSDLETKGIERCNADDDKRANDFFAQAMKILGK
ncbi:hypothetical protein ACFSQQ_11225 [Mesorhizobium kowhaii]|uniref:hypothetical protein n=1 Tax=Mesorhizobium kowhaii TaxID=1300272 RepID=UPI0035E7A946